MSEAEDKFVLVPDVPSEEEVEAVARAICWKDNFYSTHEAELPRVVDWHWKLYVEHAHGAIKALSAIRSPEGKT